MSEKEKGKLTLTNLVAISAGQVIGAGVVTLIGPAIAATGISAWPAYGVAVLVGLFSILPFIFLSSAIVLKGGEYSIVLNMLGEKPAGVYIVAFISQCLGLSLMGTSMGFYLTSIFPNLNSQVVSICAVTIFFILNLLGVSVMAKMQTILTIILITCLVAFSIIGLTKIGPQAFDFTSPDFFTNGFGGFISAVSLYAYSTYGQYMVINLSKDAKNPKKDIPLAIIISTIIIFIIYVSIALVGTSILPISETSGKPLTIVAQHILKGILFPIFIIGGPLMALATTLNSTYASRANPILRAASDGWFPEFITKCNKYKVPYIIMTAIYIVGVFPIILNMSIKEITNNIVLITYLLRMITALAIIKLPTMFEKQWKESFLHVPNTIFYFLMSLTFIAQIYMVYLSLKQLSFVMGISNISFLLICAIYALLRHKKGKVHIKSSVELK